MELADIAENDMWTSRFRRLTADLEDAARQKAALPHNNEWSEIENLPEPDRFIDETWNATADTYTNMRKIRFWSPVDIRIHTFM